MALLENVDLTVPIYCIGLSEHALGSSGITRGHFACLAFKIHVCKEGSESNLETSILLVCFFKLHVCWSKTSNSIISTLNSARTVSNRV